MSIFRKLYSWESSIRKLEGKINHITRLGDVHISGKKVHCPKIAVLFMLRKAQQKGQSLKLLVHHEQGIFLGCRYERHTVISAEPV